MTLLKAAACPYFNDTHTERIEGPGSFYHTFEFSIPGTHPTARLAVEKGEVIVPDLDGELKLFVIKTVGTESDTSGIFKRVFAEDALQEELLALVQLPVTHADDTAASMLGSVLAGSRVSVGVVESSALDTVKLTDYQTLWECVLLISKQFGLEVNTRVEADGNRITRRYIDLLRARGSYTGQVLNYGGDTASMRKFGTGGEVYTAAIGLGKSVNDVYTMFTSSVWTTGAGDPVAKPEGEWWVGDDVARYGDDSGPGYGIPLADGSVVHRMGVFRDPDEASPGRLLSKTWAWLQERTHPRYTYEAAIVAFERMPAQRPGDVVRKWERTRCGDIATVRNTECFPPFTDEVRVSETRRCYSDPTRDEVTLGAPVKRLAQFLLEAHLLKRKLRL